MSKVNDVSTSIMPDIAARKMTPEQMKQDLDYRMAQRVTKAMLDKGMITVDEFNKISALNRESFSPYLVELMAD